MKKRQSQAAAPPGVVHRVERTMAPHLKGHDLVLPNETLDPGKAFLQGLTLQFPPGTESVQIVRASQAVPPSGGWGLEVSRSKGQYLNSCFGTVTQEEAGTTCHMPPPVQISTAAKAPLPMAQGCGMARAFLDGQGGGKGIGISQGQMDVRPNWAHERLSIIIWDVMG